MKITKQIITTIILSTQIFTLSALAEVKHEYPKSRDERQAEELGSILGSEGLSFNPKKVGKSSTQSNSVTVNSYLWQATLDALSFAPLASSDALGGVIISEWYTPKSTPNTSMKIVATIKGNVIDPNNIEVKIYKRKKIKGQWVDQENASNNFALALEEKILRKARTLFISNNGTK